MNRIIAVVLALLGAVHVGIPAMGLPAPVPVLFAFAVIIGSLAYAITATIRRDGLYPCWRREAGA